MCAPKRVVAPWAKISRVRTLVKGVFFSVSVLGTLMKYRPLGQLRYLSLVYYPLFKVGLCV